MDWNMVAACANVVIATTAIVAAWYALRQYRYAVRLHELNQILSMYQAASDIWRRMPDGGPDKGNTTEILNLLETHQRVIDNGLLSAKAAAFYNDSLAINYGQDEISDEALPIIREVLRSDEVSYRHLIASLRKKEKTAFIINW